MAYKKKKNKLQRLTRARHRENPTLSLVINQEFFIMYKKKYVYIHVSYRARTAKFFTKKKRKDSPGVNALDIGQDFDGNPEENRRVKTRVSELLSKST